MGERGRTVSEGNCSGRVIVHVVHENRLGEDGFVVQARARVAVPTGTDFKVEWAIYSRKVKEEREAVTCLPRFQKSAQVVPPFRSLFTKIY